MTRVQDLDFTSKETETQGEVPALSLCSMRGRTRTGGRALVFQLSGLAPLWKVILSAIKPDLVTVHRKPPLLETNISSSCLSVQWEEVLCFCQGDSCWAPREFRHPCPHFVCGYEEKGGYWAGSLWTRSHSLKLTKPPIPDPFLIKTHQAEISNLSR